MPDEQFYELPEQIQELMVNCHTHGELAHPDEIVYREKDVCEIVKDAIEYVQSTYQSR